MIPSTLAPFYIHPVCDVHIPAHDPPLVWRSFGDEGGAGGVELATAHPALASAEIRRFDMSDLPLYELLPRALEGGSDER